MSSRKLDRSPERALSPDGHSSREVLALIPARGGSKSIPRKNIIEIAGKPLIAWSILQALESTRITRVVVSTDDDEIAAVAEEYGAEVPFIRPAEYADDRAPDIDVFRHALAFLAERESYRSGGGCASTAHRASAACVRRRRRHRSPPLSSRGGFCSIRVARPAKPIQDVEGAGRRHDGAAATPSGPDRLSVTPASSASSGLLAERLRRRIATTRRPREGVHVGGARFFRSSSRRCCSISTIQRT